ncbi:MAG: DUF3313 domain-containing protein [Rhodospirillaceae bacterium]|nr:DUF3313 domain-containing protein [Rhodospirillales bacterium]
MNFGNVVVRGLACGAVVSTLGACTGSPDSPSGLTAQAPAMQTSERLPGSISWRSPDMDPTRYDRFTIAPVKIYEGADASYGSATQADKQAMASYMQQEFSRVLGERFSGSNTPGAKAARLELTLAGLSDNIPVASTAASIAPVGLVRNIVSGGQSPIFTATVTYKGEVYDTQTGKLLAAFVTTKTPSALDLGATIDSRTAQQAAITEGARDTRGAIESAQMAAARPAR